MNNNIIIVHLNDGTYIYKHGDKHYNKEIITRAHEEIRLINHIKECPHAKRKPSNHFCVGGTSLNLHKITKIVILQKKEKKKTTIEFPSSTKD